MVSKAITFITFITFTDGRNKIIILKYLDFDMLPQLYTESEVELKQGIGSFCFFHHQIVRQRQKNKAHCYSCDSVGFYQGSLDDF